MNGMENRCKFLFRFVLQIAFMLALKIPLQISVRLGAIGRFKFLRRHMAANQHIHQIHDCIGNFLGKVCAQFFLMNNGLVAPLFDEIRCQEMIEDFLLQKGMKNVSNELLSVVASDYVESFGQKIYDELTGIQWGLKEDSFGWTVKVN